MPSRSCPHCARRLPYAGRRCVHCNWTRDLNDLQAGAGIHWWRRTRVWVVTVVAVVGLATSFAYRNATALVDWYAGFASRYLPAGAAPFVVTETEPGAFSYCARQVSRQMPGEFSVETFDAAGSQVVTLGEGRYRIESVVDQEGETGERVRHDFSCTVRYDQGRWRLEELKLDRFAGR